MNPEHDEHPVEVALARDAETVASPEEREEIESGDTDIAQTVVTVLLFVAFLSFLVVCLPFFFFH